MSRCVSCRTPSTGAGRWRWRSARRASSRSASSTASPRRRWVSADDDDDDAPNGRRRTVERSRYANIWLFNVEFHLYNCITPYNDLLRSFWLEHLRNRSLCRRVWKWMRANLVIFGVWCSKSKVAWQNRSKLPFQILKYRQNLPELNLKQLVSIVTGIRLS